MKKIALALLAVMLLMLVSCASTGSGQPDWLYSTYDAAAPSEKYLCAVGSGKDRQDAVNNALSNLSQVFSVSIDSVQTLSSSSSAITNATGKVSFADDSILRENSTISSDVGVVLGAEVRDTYQDSFGVFWVRVALDKQKTMTLYQAKVQEIITECDKLVAEVHMSENALQGLVMLSKAELKAEELDGYYLQMQVLSGKAYSSKQTSIALAKKTLASSLTFMVVTDCADESAAKLIETGFSKALSDFGISVVKEGGNCIAEIKCEFDPIKMENSPYSYCSYQISVQLTASGSHVFNWQETKRVAGMSETAAYDKAVTTALNASLDALLKETR